VYAGKVTARAGDRFRYHIDPPVDIRGFSGAPVIDRNGHVVAARVIEPAEARAREQRISMA